MMSYLNATFGSENALCHALHVGCGHIVNHLAIVDIEVDAYTIGDAFLLAYRVGICDREATLKEVELKEIFLQDAICPSSV